MHKKHIVILAESQREELRRQITAGEAPARKLVHARVLLKADRGAGGPGWTDEAIAEAVEVSLPTIARVRRRYAEEGLDAALSRRKPRREYRRRLDGEQEAHLIALACSEPPKGQGRWTLRLLAGKMVELEYSDGVSHETVRRTLKKTSSSRG